MTTPTGQAGQEIKSCCAALYSSDWARLLLGDSFHPGGLPLTERLGAHLKLRPGDRLLDAAAGRGTSAIHLARQFGFRVVGVDLSPANVAAANEAAAAARLGDRVRFVQGDAERLRFDEGSFDAVISECAFCTFPNKPAAASEFARVLRPGGLIAMTDITRAGSLPPELEGLLAWIACIADAQPIDRYISLLEDAGVVVEIVEPHDTELGELVEHIRGRLLGAQLLVKLKKLALPGGDLGLARALARLASEAIGRGQHGMPRLAVDRSEGPALACWNRQRDDIGLGSSGLLPVA